MSVNLRKYLPASGVFGQGCVMFEKDGSAGTLCPIIMAKCGFGVARPPGEPPSMTQPCVFGADREILLGGANGFPSKTYCNALSVLCD